MAKPCTLCEHPDREEMEAALLRRERTQTAIAEDLGVTSQAVSFHINNHLPEAVRLAISQEKDLQAGAKALDVLDELEELFRDCDEIRRMARETGDIELALRASDRLERQLRLYAELKGKIKPGVTVNVINNPQFVLLQTIALEVLDDYPGGREKLTERLRNELNS